MNLEKPKRLIIWDGGSNKDGNTKLVTASNSIAIINS
jgi:hypothetical protein